MSGAIHRHHFYQHHAAMAVFREWVFRDGPNLIEVFDEDGLQKRFLFGRKGILHITNLLSGDLENAIWRSQALPALLQVVLALQFLTTGNFIITAGDVTGVDVSTAWRTASRRPGTNQTHQEVYTVSVCASVSFIFCLCQCFFYFCTVIKFY